MIKILYLPLKIITVKPLNSGHLRILQKFVRYWEVIEKNVSFGIKHLFRYSWHVLYLGCQLLGGFTVFLSWVMIIPSSSFVSDDLMVFPSKDMFFQCFCTLKER